MDPTRERVQRLLNHVKARGAEALAVSEDPLMAELEREVQQLITDVHAYRQERQIFTVGPVVVFRWLAQPGWPVEYVSPNIADLTGYPAEEFATGQRPYASVIHPDDLSRVFDEVTSNSASGVAWFAHAPYRMVRADGTSIWVADYTVVRRDQEGSITHYYGYIMDMSEQIAQQERLRAQERAIAELSLPILRISRGVLVMPVLGELSRERRERMTDDLLQAINGESAHSAIIDLTGLVEFESATFDHLLRLSRAIGLLGCRCIFSGFSATSAARVVQRSLDVSRLTTTASLQSALELALRG